MATSSIARATNRRERNLVLGLAAVIVLCITVVALFGPMRDDSDPSPSTYNAGTRGVKAAYLLAQDLGYRSERWDREPGELRRMDAPNTTLVLTDPFLPVKSLKEVQKDVADFLDRGGRVVATGQSGAELLPGGEAVPTQRLYQALCFTRPEGSDPLARTGSVSLAPGVRWTPREPMFHVEHFCGDDAVVVRYRHGQGEAIWWSSPMPLTNKGIREDASLKLVVASLGPAQNGVGSRTVLFDEYFHSQREGIGSTVAGLPWWPLGLQLTAVGALLVLSFGRRNGPIRLPVTSPRTSPIEFADSMGRLYQEANATDAPIAAARAQMLRYLGEGFGFSHETLQQPAAAIAETLSARIGGDWTALGDHLDAASDAAHNAPTSKLALKLVQALEHDQKAVALQVAAAGKAP